MFYAGQHNKFRAEYNALTIVHDIWYVASFSLKARNRRAVVALIVFLCGCRNDSTAPLQSRAAVIAHRGASQEAPEHTIAAYDLALTQGADYLELDIARTKDGVLVVIHDSTADRTLRGAPGSCTGAIVLRTFAELSLCDAGSWFNDAFPSRAKASNIGLRLLRLDDVLTRYASRARFYIEIKDPSSYPGIERDLIDLLVARRIAPGRRGGMPHVYIQSFDAESLRRIKAANPDFRRVFLVGTVPASNLRSMLGTIAGFANGIAPRWDLVDAPLVQLAHASCLAVHPYTVDNLPDIQSLLEMGVDGIFSNRPSLLSSAVQSSAYHPFCLPE